MPKVKSEKRSVEKAEDGKKSSGWGKGELFGSDHPESAVQGAGFRDKEKAQETIKLLAGRDITYQFQVINTMFHRAKVIVKRTKDPEKIKNMEEAVATFQAWLDDYKSNNRARENFTYLPLDVVDAFEELADHHGVSERASDEEAEKSFLEVYREAEGDNKKLRVKPIKEGGITWDIHRNNVVRKIVGELKEGKSLFETEGTLIGLPTKEHVEIIMWGYSPEASRAKKAVATVDEKLLKVAKE